MCHFGSKVLVHSTRLVSRSIDRCDEWPGFAARDTGARAREWLSGGARQDSSLLSLSESWSGGFNSDSPACVNALGSGHYCPKVWADGIHLLAQ